MLAKTNDWLRSRRALGVAVAVGALALTPSANAQTDTCMDQCTANCQVQCGAEATGDKTGAVTPKKTGKIAKKAKKTTGVTAQAPASTQTTGDVDIDVTMPDNSRAIEDARAEERARAAEQYRAEEERIKGEHTAELDRTRAEERARAAEQYKGEMDSRIERAREEERARAAAELDKKEGALFTEFGTMVSVNGGVMNYTESEIRGATNPGGFWDVRAGVGTRSIIGAEAAYVGSAQDIDALGLNSGAWLLSNGLEGNLRINAPLAYERVLVLPYAFGGVGWQHFNLVDEGTNTSSVASEDDVLALPIGAGLSFGFSGVTLDTRATYRHTFGSDLVGSSTSSFDDVAMNNWGVGAGLGFEF